MCCGISKNTDTMLALNYKQHTLNLTLKAGVKGDMLYDNTRQQSQCKVKVRNIDLKVITLQAVREARRKQFTKGKDVNGKNERSPWRKHIFKGAMRKVR